MEYKAKQGDIVWLTLDPQAGHEQRGRRPALVISNNIFNVFTKTGAMICPITSTGKNNPIRPRLVGSTKTSGVIMCDQAKILDLEIRNAEYIERVPEDILSEVVDIVQEIVKIEQ